MRVTSNTTSTNRGISTMSMTIITTTTNSSMSSTIRTENDINVYIIYNVNNNILFHIVSGYQVKLLSL